MDDGTKAKPRKKRRLLKGLAALALLGAGLVAGLPWLLGTPPSRAFVVGRVNALLAPGSIRLGGLGVSWYGPTVLDGLTLLDPKGKAVLKARRVTLDKSVLGLLASRPDYGKITVEDAAVDVERRADGSVDLLDALAALAKPAAPAPMPPAAPAPAPAPAPSRARVAVLVKGGTLKVASPELVEPLTAATLDGSLAMNPGTPIELAAALGGDGRSLELRSTLDLGGADDAVVSVVGKGWPVHVRQSGVEAKGRFDGDLEARRAGGLWSLKGDARLDGLEAAGPALLGDRLSLDRVAATCQAGQSPAGYVVRKLELTCPVASLKAEGSIPAADGAPAQLRGKVDLAALAKMLPNAMRLRDGLALDRGTATIQLDLTAAPGLDRLAMAASLDDFAATEGGRPVSLRKPVFLAGRAHRAGAKVSVETLEVKAAGVDVKAGGDLEAGVKLSGTVDLVALLAQLRDVLDLGPLDLAGTARLAADYRHSGGSFKGRVAAEVKGLKVVGLYAGPIARDLVRLDGSATGPSRPDGLPGGWREGRLDLKAGDLKLDLLATHAGGDLAASAGFEMLVDSPVPGRFDAKAKLRKKGTLFAVDELAAGITPSDPKAAHGVVAVAIRGAFDPATGEGTFGPIPGYAVGAIGLGAEGAKVSGLGKPGAPLRVDAALVGDLTTLDRLLAIWGGAPPKGLGGLWSTKLAVIRSAAGLLDVEGTALVPGLVLSGAPRGPASIAIKAGYSPELDRVALNRLDLATQLGKVALAGGLVETGGRRMMDLTGAVEPNWAAIDPIVAASVEPNARFRLAPRTLHLAGQLRADSTPQLLDQLFGEVALDLTMAEAYGVKLGPTPVVLRMGGGSAKFDLIRTTMNDGPVFITAELALDPEMGLALRVGPSRVDGAAINEAVSNSLLSYVAPVMARSSSVSGKVTMAVTRAWVPITSTGPLSLDGALAFQNVVFKPGPLAAELNTITGQGLKDIRLDEGMLVKVADGRVTQSGLSIPVGGDGLKVAIDGSVGFDETLDLKATVPLSARALGLDAGLDKLAKGTTVSLPIRGTIARPALDRNALRVALRDAAKGLGEKQIKAEAGRFLDRIAGPKQAGGEPRSKPAGRNPLGDLENIGREILDQKKP